MTLCVSTSVIFAGVLTSAEARTAISEVLAEWFTTFTKFTGDESDETAELNKNFTPTYLPEGFSISESFDLGNIKGMRFENSDGIEIFFEYSLSDTPISVNNENVDYSIIQENNIEYHLFENQIESKDNIILWYNEGYGFSISTI